MTKKRFIKLLMSQGVRRNTAEVVAIIYNWHNIPYARAYQLDYSNRKSKLRIINSITTASKESAAND